MALEIKNPARFQARAAGTVSSSSLGLEDAPFSFTAAQLAAAGMALIQVTGNAASVAFSGSAAVAGDFVVAAGDHVLVYGVDNIANIEIIRSTASDATVLVVLFGI